MNKEDKDIMDNIKINKLEIENVTRVKAVKIEPTANGLTVIGGRGPLPAFPGGAGRLHGTAKLTYRYEQRPCGGKERQEQRPEGYGSGGE